MRLNVLVRFLDKVLRIRSIKDDSKNGLQIRGKDEISKIAFSVDACMEVFVKARQLGCQMVIVHHGLYWKRQKYKKNTAKRESFLKKNRISLYAAHLPLDCHDKYGNNIELARLLGIRNPRKWARYHGFPLGYMGKTRISRETLERLINGRLVNRRLGAGCRVLAFGPKMISLLGIVSGGGGFALEEAMLHKLDCFLVGEFSHSMYHHAKEAKLNIVIAGHYATETLGVKALAKLLHHKFNIETVFIDAPTGM
jgi:dinuclear metal center YbgI/SA1388 family protein